MTFFLIWTGTDEELDTFLKFINSIHPTIKFTHSISSKALPFLDINISLVNGYLSTDLYTKPTDCHSYLLYNSCHPSHIKKNLPYSLFLRLKRLCTEEHVFRKRSKELTETLQNRGYPKKVINDGKTRAENITRQEALEYKKQNINTRVPFITNHNPSNPPIGKWIHELQNTLINDSTRMKQVLE